MRPAIFSFQSSWFTKGLGSLDLKKAKTVLGGLAS
jgi:hypothetical protein